MKFIKHIGKHQDRRVAIVYRNVPGEEHMCLVTYPDTIPTTFHDAIMQVIESDAGQQSKELSDALFRNLLPDGRPILETLHKEGMIKKVPANQITVTPNAQSHVRLDELNKILNGIEAGDDSVKNMQKLDESAGLVNPRHQEPARKVNENQTNDNQANTPAEFSDMSNNGLAKQLLSQSTNMVAEAQAIMVESQRLQKEAWELNPSLKPKEEKKKSVRKKAVRKKATSKKKASNKTSATPTEVKVESKEEAKAE